MDCQMPVMDGFEATRAIREQESRVQDPNGTHHLPIIALTANVFERDREACLDAGMDNHLSKPFTLEQLYSLLSQWLPTRTTPAAGLDQEEAPSSGSVLEASAARPMHLDTATLDRLAAIGPKNQSDFLSRVFRLYLTQSSETIDTLREAIAQGEAASVQQAAHALKSSSGNVGALSLAAICQNLEAMGREQSLANAAVLQVDLDTEYAAVCAELAARLDASRQAFTPDDHESSG